MSLKYNHVNVPLEMCNYIVKHKKENPFRLFVYLKIVYPHGKINWNSKIKQESSWLLNCTPRTIQNNFNRLIELNWLVYDKKFGYWRIKSFEKIREQHNWELRRAFPFTYKEVLNIRASLGAVLYTQLYKTFLRKFKRGNNNVLISRSADGTVTSFSFRNRYAPVSVIGVSKIFDISISKAVRLKQEAKKEGYIKVRKNYKKIKKNEAYILKKAKQLENEHINIVYRNNSYQIQLIDKIHSDLFFKKRKKLTTLEVDL